MHARSACLVLLCAVSVSYGLLLSPSVRLSPSTQRALPQRIRVPHPAAAEDDLLDSFRKASPAPAEEQIKPLGLEDDFRNELEPEIVEPTFGELVAKMPQYEKVCIAATLPCSSPA